MGMEQLHSGEIYYPSDDSIMEVQLKCYMILMQHVLLKWKNACQF